MTYTPEQLLNIAFDAEHIGKHSNGIAAYKSHWLSEIFRAHAAALEEVERLRAAHEHTAIQLTKSLDAYRAEFKEES